MVEIAKIIKQRLAKPPKKHDQCYKLTLTQPFAEIYRKKSCQYTQRDKAKWF